MLNKSQYIFSSWNVYVEEIMIKDVKCVSFVSTYKELKDLIEDTKFRTYPLVDSPGKLTTCSNSFYFL